MLKSADVKTEAYVKNRSWLVISNPFFMCFKKVVVEWKACKWFDYSEQLMK